MEEIARQAKPKEQIEAERAERLRRRARRAELRQRRQEARGTTVWATQLSRQAIAHRRDTHLLEGGVQDASLMSEILRLRRVSKRYGQLLANKTIRAVVDAEKARAKQRRADAEKRLAARRQRDERPVPDSELGGDGPT